jgi:hypothetical protein
VLRPTCIYIGIQEYIYIYEYVPRIYIYIYIPRIYIYIGEYKNISIYIYRNIPICIGIYICLYITYIFLYSYIYRNIRIYIYI